RFLNPAYVHIPAVPEWNELSSEVRTSLLADVNSMRELTPATDGGTQMEDTERVIHHKAIFQLRMQAWEQMFARFQDQHAGSRSERGVDFRAFCEESGEALHRLAVHDALYEHFINCQPPVYGFRSWPEAFRHPESPAVQEFTYNRQDRIAFYKYLYWCASRELEAVHALLLESGIALNLDLAVGADADGAEVWSQRDVFALHASAGAPPDPFSPSGQDWSLAPFHPESLKEQQYAPFTQLLRANMPEKGVIRMDHILQLFRLFWVVRDSVPHNALSQETPDGVHASTSAAQEQAADLDSADVIDTFPAVRGSYLRYPTEDLLRILALESQRRRCMVIGEDLGTVPPEVRETLQRYGIYSWRVTYFEKNHEAGGFVPADQYPELSVASVNTHDLPTFPGFWLGRDIEARRRIGIFTNEEAQREWEQRTRDRNEMGQLLIRTGCFDGLQNNPMLNNWPGLKQYSDPDMTEWAARIQARASEGDPDALQLLNLAMQYFLDRTHSGMRLFSLADLLLDLDQPNLPGTTDQYPNWSLYYPVDVHTAADQIRNFMDILEAMRSTKSPDY
ncbi:MAG: 4-alpha-glucanotransferase, partial [Leptospiraceae bacterium]|nr:4-alpha-glucanotransferase [Leptospiraceae bacterium]